MTESQKQSDRFDQLRTQAEILIKDQPRSPAVPTEMLELIHELKVHQAELEIQNEELQRAQQEINALHREYVDLYEFAPCGYIVLNPKGMISRVNLTGVKLLGAERTQLKHLPLSSFICPGHQGIYFHALQKAAQSGDRQSVEIMLKDEADSHTWVRADIKPDLTHTGELIQWRLVLVDATETKRAEQKSRDYQHKLKSLTSEMTLTEERIMHTLALRIHDQISQIVAMCRVKLGMVAESLCDPQAKAMLVEAYSDLGDALSEARSITSELDCPELHIFGLKEAISSWAAQNIKKKHPVDTVVTGNEGGKALAEDTKCILFRSLRELLWNVVKHAQASRVEVNIQHAQEYIEVRVADNGIGFPKDAEPDNLQSGFGLLSIRESMERLGGQLTIDSASNRGMTITLRLPLYRTSRMTEIASEDPPEGAYP